MSISVQNVPVCKNHVDAKLPEIKCACGSWTELREGKWGPFFLCLSCGPISFSKGMEMLKFMKPKEVIQVKTGPVSSPSFRSMQNHAPANTTAPTPTQKKPMQRQIIQQTVRSDDPRFFD
jgi:hypothetical protein